MLDKDPGKNPNNTPDDRELFMFLGCVAEQGEATDERARLIQKFNDDLSKKMPADWRGAITVFDGVVMVNDLPSLEHPGSLNATSPAITIITREQKLFYLYINGLLSPDNIRRLTTALYGYDDLVDTPYETLRPGSTVLIITDSRSEYPQYGVYSLIDVGVAMTQGGATIDKYTEFKSTWQQERLGTRVALKVSGINGSGEEEPQTIVLHNNVDVIDNLVNGLSELLKIFKNDKSLAYTLLILCNEISKSKHSEDDFDMISLAIQKVVDALTKESNIEGVDTLPSETAVYMPKVIHLLKNLLPSNFYYLDNNVAKYLARQKALKAENGYISHTKDEVLCRRWVYELTIQKYPELQEPELGDKFEEELQNYEQRGQKIINGDNSGNPDETQVRPK